MSFGRRSQFSPDCCFPDEAGDRGGMNSQTKESFTASLPSSPVRAAAVGWDRRFPAVGKWELQQNCFLCFLINLPVYTASIYSSGSGISMVMLQKYKGNGGIMKPLNLPFGFNSQAA